MPYEYKLGSKFPKLNQLGLEALRQLDLINNTRKGVIILLMHIANGQIPKRQGFISNSNDVYRTDGVSTLAGQPFLTKDELLEILRVLYYRCAEEILSVLKDESVGLIKIHPNGNEVFSENAEQIARGIVAEYFKENLFDELAEIASLKEDSRKLVAEALAGKMMGKDGNPDSRMISFLSELVSAVADKMTQSSE